MDNFDIKVIKHKVSNEIKRKKLPIKLVYLFGSFAKGKESIKSDIDIAVLLKEDVYSKDPICIFGNIQSFARKLERIIKREVDIHILNRASLNFSYVVVTTGIPIYTSSRIELYKYQNKILGMFFDFIPFFEKYLTAYERV